MMPADRRFDQAEKNTMNKILAAAFIPSVSGNWRVTFRFVGKDADDVDYEDYH